MSDKIRSLLKSKNLQDFAKLLTEIDRLGTAALKISEIAQPKSHAFRIGITGPPGAGKSTLVSEIIKILRTQKLKIGVLAVDPSSPFSHGALLGDRIRYAEALEDPEVFVRSVGSRGSPGGLSASSYLLLRAFDVAAFDIVLIETVGVGQTELEIMNVADMVLVVLVPESGDEIQMMKSGLMEIGDVFLVNKADRPGAESLVHELRESLTYEEQESKPVFKTIATENKGVNEVVKYFLNAYKEKSFIKNRVTTERLQAEAKALLRHMNEEKIQKTASRVRSVKDFVHLLTSADFEG